MENHNELLAEAETMLKRLEEKRDRFQSLILDEKDENYNQLLDIIASLIFTLKLLKNILDSLEK